VITAGTGIGTELFVKGRAAQEAVTEIRRLVTSENKCLPSAFVLE